MEKQTPKHNWLLYVVVAIFLLLIIGAVGMVSLMLTGQSSYNAKSLGMEASSVPVMDSYYGRAASSYYYDSSFAPGIEERKIIKNANLNLEVKNFEISKSNIIQYSENYDVIVLSESQNKYQNDYRQISYSLKVPSDNLDSFLEDIKSNGEVLYFNVYSNDVTGTYIDYTDRLERYNEQIEDYKLMLNRDKIEVEEEIKIQQRIDQLEDQIYYIESRLKTIDEEIQYSEVSLTLKEKPSVISEIDFLGIRDGTQLFLKSLDAGMRFIFIAIGFLLPFGILFGLYRLGRRFL